MQDSFCQTSDLLSPSRKHSRLFTIIYQLRHNLKKHGILATSKKAWRKLFVGTELTGPQLASHAVSTDNGHQVLRLQPGEWVEVRSREEICLTLDPGGKNRGLGFMPEMWEYCGTQLRVLKRVEKICLENAPRTVRKMENTVLLEGAFCKGSGIGCDRACFYFWRECWLKRRLPIPSVPSE